MGLLGVQVINVVSWVLNLYWYLIFARILLSWFPDVFATSLGRFILRLTEPYLAPFRRVIPPLRIGGVYLDVSVYAAIIVFYFAENGLLWLLGYLLSLVGL